MCTTLLGLARLENNEEVCDQPNNHKFKTLCNKIPHCEYDLTKIQCVAKLRSLPNEIGVSILDKLQLTIYEEFIKEGSLNEVPVKDIKVDMKTDRINMIHNALEDIDLELFFSLLPKSLIKNLVLGYNQIENIFNLTLNLPYSNLVEIYLSNNKIKNIDSLSLRGNPIENIDRLTEELLLSKLLRFISDLLSFDNDDDYYSDNY
jgi:hypothetical protein